MSESPIKAYNRRIADKTMHPDPAQKRAAEALDGLYARLVKIAPSPQPSPLWGEGVRAMRGRVRRWFGTKEGTKGIYLYGGVGRGKSMLMDMFYRSLPDALSKRRVHFHAFMIEVHDYIHARQMEDDFHDGIDGVLPSLASKIAKQSRVLCFDEFHVTDVADAMILGRLFTGLFARGVVVVATSNWPPDDLYKGGLQRDRFLPFIALLKDKMEIIRVDGDRDYRVQVLKTEGSYFHPLNDENAARVNALFEKLTGAAIAQDEKIHVKGRVITARAANGTARFTFDELCARALGAEDYIAIAHQYRVVFLENIPAIPSDRRNEAKRLMTLIDALYEAKTKLIITAATPPEGIYAGHDHGFEFHRTVSRLMEMGG
jgi:cell division protein ZapE